MGKLFKIISHQEAHETLRHLSVLTVLKLSNFKGGTPVSSSYCRIRTKRKNTHNTCSDGAVVSLEEEAELEDDEEEECLRTLLVFLLFLDLFEDFFANLFLSLAASAAVIFLSSFFADLEWRMPGLALRERI